MKLTSTLIDDFKIRMEIDGWYQFQNAYSEDLIDSVNEELSKLDEIYAPIQKRCWGLQ